MTDDPTSNALIVSEALDALFNKRDFAVAERYWAADYLQHSAIIGPGRDGLFELVRSLPDLRHERGRVVAQGDIVMVHGRYTGDGRPMALVAVDIFRVSGGKLVEHWDVLQDEASRSSSKSGLPMFGSDFPA